MIDIGAIAVTSSAIARKSPRIAGSFNAICITGITGLLITNAGSIIGALITQRSEVQIVSPRPILYAPITSDEFFRAFPAMLASSSQLQICS